MNRVVEILMKRDGYSKEEAIEIVNDCREEINEAIADGDYDLAEDIPRFLYMYIIFKYLGRKYF